MHSRRSMILLRSWRLVGMAYITEVLQWTDTGSLGKMGWEDEEVELPFM